MHVWNDVTAIAKSVTHRGRTSRTMSVYSDDHPTSTIKGGESDEYPWVRERDLDRVRDLGMLHARLDPDRAALVPPQQGTHRSVAAPHRFQIPRVTFRPRRGFVAFPLAM